MNTDKLQPGRKLDATIAELLGWRCVRLDEITGKWTGIPAGDPLNKQQSVIWSYSISEGDAGAVQDWLARQGYAVTIHTGLDDGRLMSHCCVIHLVDGSRRGSIVTDLLETRPLAICQAMLRVAERWGK